MGQTSRSRRLAVAALGALAIATLAPLETSGAVFTATSRNATSTITAAADWTPPQVALTAPAAIRGTHTLTATASDAESGIADVVLAWTVEDGTTWTTICTRTAAPYSCAFATAGIADGFVDLRAVATDKAAYTSTALVESVLIDNTAPTASLSVPTPIAGTVTVSPTVSDAGSGIASVVVQLSSDGANWSTACTATVAPWSCRFDSTTVPDGTYEFRAVVTDGAGNTTTTTSVKNRQIDNRQSSVSMDPIDAILRDTEVLTATANSNAGVTSVRIEFQRVGTSTWTTVCTATVKPYSCSWNTKAVADGDVLVRAVLLDGAGKTTTSATVSGRIDNSPTRGADVQATNGGSLGRIDANDRLTLTWTRPMRTTSILAGWNGGAQAVTIRIRDGGVLGLGNSDDTLDVFTSATFQTPVALGSVNLRDNYVRSGRTVTFTGTMTHSLITVNGVQVSAVTLTIGTTANTSWLRTASTSPTMVWTPSSAAVDTDGVATSTAPVTESGAADRDL